MGTEIERKFLVQGDEWRTASPRCYWQGYLNQDPNRSARVRLVEDSAGARAFMTVKGISRGASRVEFEYDIPPEDARQMLEGLCLHPLIGKDRHKVEYEGFVWEIDEFFGENAGLIMAEVELASEDQAAPIPPWIGAEVTGKTRYFNANLGSHPYSQWNEDEKAGR